MKTESLVFCLCRTPVSLSVLSIQKGRHGNLNSIQWNRPLRGALIITRAYCQWGTPWKFWFFAQDVSSPAGTRSSLPFTFKAPQVHFPLRPGPLLLGLCTECGLLSGQPPSREQPFLASSLSAPYQGLLAWNVLEASSLSLYLFLLEDHSLLLGMVVLPVPLGT